MGTEEIRPPVYVFGGWEIDLARRELRSGGVPVQLGSRAFEIIAELAKAAGELVTKNDLMDRVWPGAIVEDNALQVHITAIRKLWGQTAGCRRPRSVEVIACWGRGRLHKKPPFAPRRPATRGGRRRNGPLRIFPSRRRS